MATTAERQQAYRDRAAAMGLVPVTVFVPREHASAFKVQAALLSGNRDLEPGALRNAKTGRVVKTHR